MSFAQKFFRFLTPKNQIVVYADPYANGWLGAPLETSISPEAAMACSAVYACVRVLADGIATMPCVLMYREGRATYPDTTNTLYNVLNLSPWTPISSFTYWRWNITSLLLRGFFLSLIMRAGNGKIIGLLPVHPNHVSRIELTTLGRLQFTITKRDGSVTQYDQNDVFFVPYATGRDVDDPEGPLRHNGRPIHLASVSEDYMYNHIRHDGKPNGYWKKDGTLKDEAAFKRLRAQLNDAIGGENGGKTPLIEEGIEFKAVALSAVDMQMIEQKRYTVEDICGIFGVPPHKIGDVKQAKGWATLEQQQTEFVAESLAPIAVRIEKEINRQLVPRQSWGMGFAKFKFNSMLRGDTNNRRQFYQTMWQLGCMSINEIRELEDMNPIDGGDVYFTPLNFQQLQDNGMRLPLDDQNGGNSNA